MHEKFCPKIMLDFYENVKSCIKAVLAVKSYHLCSSVRILESFVGISYRKCVCPAKLPDLCVHTSAARREGGGKREKTSVC